MSPNSPDPIFLKLPNNESHEELRLACVHRVVGLRDIVDQAELIGPPSNQHSEQVVDSIWPSAIVVIQGWPCVAVFQGRIDHQSKGSC